ncbi:hypothetical protein Fcan01_10822 [Folsomia candida]|uniref:C-type lectin domain-containing protein n=1 Tax=Folsomia candida TaxID=158441 RepID=A0A226E8K0_FOLCA|nr:hypothetical protein Fcan01_10822 [Folsomia candida]
MKSMILVLVVMITGGIASASTFNNNNNDFPDRTFNNNNDQFMGSTNNNNNNRFPGTTNNNNNNGFPGSITNNNNNGFPGGSINNNNNGFPGSGSITNNNGFPNSPPNNNNGFPQGSFTNNNNNGLHWSGTNNDNNIDNSTGIDNTTGALLSESGSSGNSPTSTILGPPSSFPNNRCPFGQLINNNNGDKQVLCLESPIYNFNINVANSDASGKVSNNPVQNTPTTKQSEILARNKDLKYAGKFGNKMYFTLPTAGSWKYARDACAGAKLQMIALASYAERDYINNALGTSTRYWTSGKQVDAYKWENGTNVGLVYRSAWIENCLLIYFGGIYADPCNGKAFEYYPLCQTDSDN